MGQKVHPLALRLGYTKNWRSLWFAQRREFSDNIKQDFKIRKYIREKFEQAAVSMIIIERLAEQVKVRIHTARPGVIIGRRGADIDRLRAELKDITKKDMDKIVIDIQEIKNPNVDAQLVAQAVAFQLQKRVAFRRAMKRAIEQSRQSGAKGIKIRCAGRLGVLKWPVLKNIMKARSLYRPCARTLIMVLLKPRQPMVCWGSRFGFIRVM